MNERIRELAEQAGCVQHEFIWVANNFDMERFVELVRQDEREACAQLVEEVGRQTATAIRGKTE